MDYHIWTPSAIMCYKRQQEGLGCKGCYYNTFFSKEPTQKLEHEFRTRDLYTFQTCQMKNSIIDLIKNIGLPDTSEQMEEEDDQWNL